jgi:hypothetical protein
LYGILPLNFLSPNFLFCLQVVSLPHFVTSLVVENATGGVVLMRGAVRVNNDGDTSFRLVINKASHFVS